MSQEQSSRHEAYYRLVNDAEHSKSGISSITSIAAFLAREAGLSHAEILAAIQVGESRRSDGYHHQEPQGEILDVDWWDNYWRTARDEVLFFWDKRYDGHNE